MYFTYNSFKLIFILAYNISEICHFFWKQDGKNVTFWKVESHKNRSPCISMDNN